MTNTRSGGASRDTPPSSAGGTGTPSLRRSTRQGRGKRNSDEAASTPAPSTAPSPRSARAARNAAATMPSSAKKPKPTSASKRKYTRTNSAAAAALTPSPASRKDSNGSSSASVPASKKDSNGASSAPAPATKAAAKRKSDGHGPDGDDQEEAQSAGRQSKKPKRLSTKSYIALFKPSGEQVLPSPVTEAEQNASQSQTYDKGAVLVSGEGGPDDRELQSVDADKVLEGHSTANSDSESHMPVQMCLLNKAPEMIPTMEAGQQATGNSNQNSEPRIAAHHEEANKAIEEGDSIGILGACTSRQPEAIQCDVSGYNEYMCAVCKSRKSSDILKSCDGKGCQHHYHLSCIDPPLESVSPGIWLCIICTKKRIQFGVYSVSEGIESLWDVKDGANNSKLYFVKYKNLSHVHNRWVSESDIVDSTPEGSDLISKFCKRIHKEKTIMWKQEWAEPHRLLKKRSLMPPTEAEVFFSSLGDKFTHSNVEWLVKWKDLGYEHATWELEASLFLLCAPEAEELKRSYVNRHEAARRALDRAKISKVKEGVFQKFQKLPDGCPPGLDHDHLSSLNQLCELWHNSRGAIIVDDQERVIKTVLFVMSILPDICQPILIVSTSASLSVWEAKFSRLAASINVVVYNGEKDVRKSIQDLEFYNNGSMMLQVLLSHPDAILEDIEVMEQISWEAVMVDDCQNSRVSKCLEQLKRLPTNFRMVLLSSPLKENISEYINLLSFLNPEENCILSVSNSNYSDTDNTPAVLKTKLAQYVAFERKADSSKFQEYWVPARLSHVQLEMYCHTLLSNSPALRSHLKTDTVGALRNILVSLRKCCDHPYLVDETLQGSLAKGHPETSILDIGVHSSGKLLLLDKMLQKIRTEGLRVVILSQSAGGSGNPMGDILDDFIRQRFGNESYERLERGLQLQKKHRAMNMFNDKTKGRSIFLMDSRACLPSIKLSSVDVIIIYGSDWNPMNDLRALQRTSIESQSEHIPIFRLYSSFTLEEKALVLAKQDHIPEINIQNISPSLSHCLLSWGASLLFNRLEEFQNHNHLSKGSDCDKPSVDDVILEFVTKLSTKVEVSSKLDNAVISQAHLRGSSYSKDISVAGEGEGISSLDGDLQTFWNYWLKLLDGRSPCWQHIPTSPQRSRRKIQTPEQLISTEEQLKMPSEETYEARMKRRKIGENMDSSLKVVPGRNNETLLSGNSIPSNSHQISVDDTWQEQETDNLHGTQKGLHIELKPELAKLYKLLELPDSVKSFCEELLDYILKNHQVSQEPKGILHAFNIALCWRAASLLKHKVNRKESVALAVKNLNYECDEGLAEFVYVKLRILKKRFARRAGETSKQNQPTPASNISPCEQETSTKLSNDESIPGQATSEVDGNFGNGLHQEDPGNFWAEEMVSGEKELLSDSGTRVEKRLSRDELLSRIMDNKIKLVDKVFSLRGKSIREKYSNEVSLLDIHKQKEVAKLREACTLVVEHLRGSQSHIDQESRHGKIKLVIKWFTLLLYAFLEHMQCQRNKLDMQQSAAWAKESQLREELLQAAKSGQLDHSFDQHIPLPCSDFAMEEFRHFREEVGSCHVNAASSTLQSLDDNSAMEVTLVRSINASEVSTTEEARNVPAEVLVQRPASEVADLLLNNSDGIDSQGDASLAVQHSLSSSPLIDNSVYQGSSGGDDRSAEHVEGEISVSSPLQGGTSHHVGDAAIEVTAGDSDTAGADSSHLHAHALIAPSSQGILPVSREVETPITPVTQPAQLALVQSQLAQGEPEEAGLSGVSSAQSLESERQQSIPVSNNPLERAQQPDHDPGHQTDATRGSSDLSWMMVNHPPICDEPLKNELNKLRLHKDTLDKTNELKKSQLRMEYSQEMEKLKRKYDLLIEEQDSTHIQQTKILDDMCEKIIRQQALASDFRAKFISPSAPQAARAHRSQVCRTQASQQVPMRSSVAGPSVSPITSSSAGPPLVQRPRVQVPQVDRSSSSSSLSQMGQPAPFIPGNFFRATSAPVSHMPPARGSYGIQSELGARAPAPHLQFRSPRSPSMQPGNQQQLPTGLDAASSRTQFAPITSVGTSSVSNSQPVMLAGSGPSDSHMPHQASSAMPPVSNSASLVPSCSSPGHAAQNVPSTVSPALPVTTPTGLNIKPSVAASAPPAGRHAAPLVLADSSVSLDAFLAATLGLRSDSPSARAPTTTTTTTTTTNGDIDVVCLSDSD